MRDYTREKDHLGSNEELSKHLRKNYDDQEKPTRPVSATEESKNLRSIGQQFPKDAKIPINEARAPNSIRAFARFYFESLASEYQKRPLCFVHFHFVI